MQPLHDTLPYFKPSVGKRFFERILFVLPCFLNDIDEIVVQEAQRVYAVVSALSLRLACTITGVTIVTRTYGAHKSLHISPFLPTTFGPRIYYGPP